MAVKHAQPEIVRALLARRNSSDSYLRLDLRDAAGPDNIPKGLTLRVKLRNVEIEEYREVERLPARECLGGLWVAVLFAPVESGHAQLLELLRSRDEEQIGGTPLPMDALPLPGKLLEMELHFAGGSVRLARNPGNRYLLTQVGLKTSRTGPCAVNRVLLNRKNSGVELLIWRDPSSTALPPRIVVRLRLDQDPRSDPFIPEFREAGRKIEASDGSCVRVYLAPAPKTASRRARWQLQIAPGVLQSAVQQIELRMADCAVILTQTPSGFFCPNSENAPPSVD